MSATIERLAHPEPGLEVKHAIQSPDTKKTLFDKRTESTDFTPTKVSFGPFRLLPTEFLLLEGEKPVSTFFASDEHGGLGWPPSALWWRSPPRSIRSRRPSRRRRPPCSPPRAHRAMNDQLSALKLFTRAARVGNLSSAGRELDLPQPSASRVTECKGSSV
jgi:hypothetical protein